MQTERFKGLHILLSAALAILSIVFSVQKAGRKSTTKKQR